MIGVFVASLMNASLAFDSKFKSTCLYEGKTVKRPLYGEPYSKRLPSNFDLDIQIGKTLKYANNKSLEFSIELMNVSSLLRENVADIKYNDNYEEDGTYKHMGFLPAFHVNYRF